VLLVVVHILLLLQINKVIQVQIQFLVQSHLPVVEVEEKVVIMPLAIEQMV
jgi:hypothetical protein